MSEENVRIIVMSLARCSKPTYQTIISWYNPKRQIPRINFIRVMRLHNSNKLLSGHKITDGDVIRGLVETRWIVVDICNKSIV